MLIHLLSYLDDSYIKQICVECLDYLTYIFNNKEDLEEQSYGLLYGATGVALSLLYGYVVFKDENYKTTSEKLLRIELEHLKQSEYDDTIYLPYSNKMQRLSPYWAKGNAGLVAVLTRYSAITKNDITDGKFPLILQGMDITFSVGAGQFYGMSGLAETYIDLYKYTGQKNYLTKAKSFLPKINLYMMNDEYRLIDSKTQLCSVSVEDGSKGVFLLYRRIQNITLSRLFFADEVLKKYENYH